VLGLVVSRCAVCGRVVRAGLIFAWSNGDDATGNRLARKTAIGLLAGGVPPWAVSPLVVRFPLRCLEAVPPPVPLSRVAASCLPCVLSSLASRRLADLPATNMVAAPLLLQSSAASRTFKDFHTHELVASTRTTCTPPGQTA